MHPYVHCSIIYNCQDVEATQVPINRRWDKEAVVHVRNGLLLSLLLYLPPQRDNRVLETDWICPNNGFMKLANLHDPHPAEHFFWSFPIKEKYWRNFPGPNIWNGCELFLIWAGKVLQRRHYNSFDCKEFEGIGKARGVCSVESWFEAGDPWATQLSAAPIKGMWVWIYRWIYDS